MSRGGKESLSERGRMYPSHGPGQKKKGWTLIEAKSGVSARERSTLMTAKGGLEKRSKGRKTPLFEGSTWGGFDFTEKIRKDRPLKRGGVPLRVYFGVRSLSR